MRSDVVGGLLAGVRRALGTLGTQKVPSTRVANSFRELVSVDAVFVLSPGRSGTQALTDFLARYTNMYCVHAPKPWLATVGYRFHQGNATSDFALGAFYCARESHLKTAFERGQTFFDGDCKNLPLATLIAGFLPNSRFLHVVRRPEQFIESGYRRGYFQALPPELWGHLEKVRSTTGYQSPEERISKLAYFWEESNRIAEDVKSSVGDRRAATLVAEEFFSRPDCIFDALKRLLPDIRVSRRRGYQIKHLNQQRAKEPLPPYVRKLIDEAVGQICLSRHLYYGVEAEQGRG